jgi:ankyrin repeat protein
MKHSLIAMAALLLVVSTGNASPLHKAIKKRDLALVQKALENGADVDGVYQDHSALTLAALYGQKEIAELLIAKGAMVTINVAARLGKIEVVKKRLAEGVSVNTRDSWKRTPLFNTSTTEIAKLLIAKGADIKARGQFKSTPLHFAKNRKIAELLIAKGADINARGEHNRTPLHEAAFKANKSILLFLIAKGADVNAIDNMGKTPLDRANKVESWQDENKKKKIAKLLREHGAKAGAELIF